MGLRAALLLVVALVVAPPWPAAAQVTPLPPPGAKVTVIEPTFEPPFRLTIRVYVSDVEGRRLFVPGQGVSLRLTDPQGRRLGLDPLSGALAHEIPEATYGPVTNPEPDAPIGPRGLSGNGIELNAPLEGRYLLEITGTDTVGFDIAVAEWDRNGRRRWLFLSRGATEPGAVDRYDLTYTPAVRQSIDLRERWDPSMLSIRASRTAADRGDRLVTELLLTDPRGRRLGFEPKTRHAIREIPRASYGESGQVTPDNELEIMRPENGAYTLDVIGTGRGRYDLDVRAVDTQGESGGPPRLEAIPTVRGAVHRYVFTYASAPKSPVPRLEGAWGQGARLLSYAYPTAARTELARGQRAVWLVVFYAPTIVTRSFRATLDGVDVTARFRPAPGGHDVVSLALGPGASTLALSVNGTDASGRAVSHAERLVFVRP